MDITISHSIINKLARNNHSSTNRTFLWCSCHTICLRHIKKPPASKTHTKPFQTSCKGKGHPHDMPMQAEGGSGSIATIHSQPTTWRRWVVTALPPRKDVVSTTGGWVGSVRTAWKITPPRGFNPWTVQHGASHYTSYAISAAANFRTLAKTKYCQTPI
jgi:hypothetical protein